MWHDFGAIYGTRRLPRLFPAGPTCCSRNPLPTPPPPRPSCSTNVSSLMLEYDLWKRAFALATIRDWVSGSDKVEERRKRRLCALTLQIDKNRRTHTRRQRATVLTATIIPLCSYINDCAFYLVHGAPRNTISYTKPGSKRAPRRVIIEFFCCQLL